MFIVLVKKKEHMILRFNMILVNILGIKKLLEKEKMVYIELPERVNMLMVNYVLVLLQILLKLNLLSIE